jgi:hypothetical protein
MGVITECVNALMEQFLQKINGVLANLICSRIYENGAGRAIRPKCNMDQVVGTAGIDRSISPAAAGFLRLGNRVAALAIC